MGDERFGESDCIRATECGDEYNNEDKKALETEAPPVK